MINKELNLLLHNCLDNQVEEVNIIDIIESFIIEESYFLTYDDESCGITHTGIISKSLRNKFDKKINNCNLSLYKQIWNNIDFNINHKYVIHNNYLVKYDEKILQIQSKKYIMRNKLFLLARNQHVLVRLYYLLFHKESFI